MSRPTDILRHYVQLFIRLKGGTNQYNRVQAPHRPILLLAVMDLFRQGHLTDQRIYLDHVLVDTFHRLWDELVLTKHVAGIHLPFFHMQSQPFWKLVAKPGETIGKTSKNSARSFGNLQKTVDYAEIDEELALLFSNPMQREILNSKVIEAHFPHAQIDHLLNGISLVDEIASFTREPAPQYRNRLERLRKRMQSITPDEFETLRNAAFRKNCLKNYEKTCAISQLCVRDDRNRKSLVEACHIIPWAESFDDSHRNAIALNPLLHRAFDNYQIAISAERRVLVSNQITEAFPTPHSILQFRGYEVRFPKSEAAHPDLAIIAEHRNRFLQRESH